MGEALDFSGSYRTWIRLVTSSIDGRRENPSFFRAVIPSYPRMTRYRRLRLRSQEGTVGEPPSLLETSGKHATVVLRVARG